MPIRLTNFVARITSEVILDDGVEVVRKYEMAATQGSVPYRFSVAANQFKNLGWVAEHLGASALIEPGQGMQARIPHAIQVISEEIPKRYIYSHTGWREIDGQIYFLDRAGALGAYGRRMDIEVSLPEQLALVELVEPDSDEVLREAVRSQLLLCHLAPVRVTAPMLGAVYRAPLTGSDVTIAPWGKTGNGKTAIAALMQQNFGPRMDARRLPLHWESTANTIEAVLSAAKDIVAVVDEYVPGESPTARAKLQDKAERIMRGVGNASGRGRMRADLTLRPARPPRCQLLSTGEEVPTGQSLRARMISVEVRAGDTNWAMVTSAQQEAAAGTYATAMAAYVIWLSQDFETCRSLFEADRIAVRDLVQAQHKRVADAVAQLTAAWNMYLSFAVDIGAIEESMAERIKADVWAGLTEVAAEQTELQTAAEPVSRFRDLLVALLSTGRGHVASSRTGKVPENEPARWGWRRDEYDWSPRGDCIGWVTDDGVLWLEPDVAYTTASRLGAIGISSETLGQRLADANVTVIDVESGRRRYRVKRKTHSHRPRVYHIRTTDWLYPPDSGAIGAGGAKGQKPQVEQEFSRAPH